MDDRPHCVQCGEIVGVYEPARLLLSDGTEHDGSPLTLGQQFDMPGAIVVHERCYEIFTQQRS